jgi:hypothetical protein
MTAPPPKKASMISRGMTIHIPGSRISRVSWPRRGNATQDSNSDAAIKAAPSASGITQTLNVALAFAQSRIQRKVTHHGRALFDRLGRFSKEVGRASAAAANAAWLTLNLL